MKKLIFISVLAVLLSSCGKTVFYQVYDFDSKDVVNKDDVMKYENEDCKISYNLWAKGGNASFYIHNKTEKNIYLILPESFFILNGIAQDYYAEITKSQSVNMSLGASLSNIASIGGLLYNSNSWYPATVSRKYGESMGVTRTNSISIKDSPIVCVPPLSTKHINGFYISDYVYKDCGDTKTNYPKGMSRIIQYNKSNTPLSFRNRLAYSFDRDAETIKYIENEFWLKSVQNFSKKAALKKEEFDNCEYGKAEREVFTISGPSKFFNTYEKVANPTK